MNSKLSKILCAFLAGSVMLLSSCALCKSSNSTNEDQYTVSELTVATKEDIPLVEESRYYDVTSKSAQETYEKIVALKTLYPSDNDSKKDLDKKMQDLGFKNRITSSFYYEAATGPSSYIKNVRFEGCSTGMDYDTVELGTFPYLNIVVQIDNYEKANAVFDLLCDYMSPTEEVDKTGKLWRVYGEDRLSYVELATTNNQYALTFEIYIYR